MRKSKSVTSVVLIVLFLTVGLSQRADAYIDMGTGSYLLQLVLATLFGMIFTAKSVWAKVRAIRGGSPDCES